MKNNNNTSKKEMFEFHHLIQKEKEGALRSFEEEDFRSQLSQRIAEEPKTHAPLVFRSRKPLIAAGTVLLLMVLGWAAVQVFAPSSSKSDAKAIEKVLIQALTLHGNMAALSSPLIEPETSGPGIHEFEWSIKRVIYSIHRERIPDEEIPLIFNQVLQNVAVIKTEEKDSGKLRLNRENPSLRKENSFRWLFSQT